MRSEGGRGGRGGRGQGRQGAGEAGGKEGSFELILIANLLLAFSLLPPLLLPPPLPLLLLMTIQIVIPRAFSADGFTKTRESMDVSSSSQVDR